ncbi:MAG: K(+)-transporting ATPase subunit F [Acidimicrobiales bacterium]
MTALTTATVDNWVALAVAVALIVFMLVALLHPERF